MNNLSNREMACFKAALALVVAKHRLKQQRQQNGEKRPDANDDRKKHSKKRRTADSLIFPWSTSKPRSMPTSSQKEHLQTILTKAVRTAQHLDDDNSDASWSSLRALTAHLAQQLTLSLVGKQQSWVAEWIRDCLLQPLKATEGCYDTASTRRTNCIQAAFLVWHGILVGDFSTSLERGSKSPKVVPSPACRRLFQKTFCSILEEEEITDSNSFVRDCSERAVQEQAPSVISQPTIKNPTPNFRLSCGNAWQGLFSPTNHNRNEQRDMLVDSNKRLDVWCVHGLQLLHKIKNDVADSVLPCKSFLPPSNWIKWYSHTAYQRLEDPMSVLDPGAKVMAVVALYQAQGQAFVSKSALEKKEEKIH